MPRFVRRKRIVIAGAEDGEPLVQAITSCSCSQSSARSSSFVEISHLRLERQIVASAHRSSLPSVVSASRSVPRRPGGQALNQVLEQPPGRRAAELARVFERLPLALQRHLHGLRVDPASGRRLPDAARRRRGRRRRARAAMRHSCLAASAAGMARVLQPLRREREGAERTPSPLPDPAPPHAARRSAPSPAPRPRASRFVRRRARPECTNAVSAVSLLAMPSVSRS